MKKTILVNTLVLGTVVLTRGDVKSNLLGEKHEPVEALELLDADGYALLDAEDYQLTVTQ